jgi:hypothetical protein
VLEVRGEKEGERQEKAIHHLNCIASHSIVFNLQYKVHMQTCSRLHFIPAGFEVDLSPLSACRSHPAAIAYH